MATAGHFPLYQKMRFGAAERGLNSILPDWGETFETKVAQSLAELVLNVTEIAGPRCQGGIETQSWVLARGAQLGKQLGAKPVPLLRGDSPPKREPNQLPSWGFCSRTR
jgi:hypothetical protein